jgi:hypothetical protein
MGDPEWTEVRRGKRGSSSSSEIRGNDSSLARGGGGGGSSREMFSGNHGMREDRGSRGRGNGGRRGGRVDQYAAPTPAPSHLDPSRNGTVQNKLLDSF